VARSLGKWQLAPSHDRMSPASSSPPPGSGEGSGVRATPPPANVLFQRRSAYAHRHRHVVQATHSRSPLRPARSAGGRVAGGPSTRIDTTPDLEVVVWTAWRTAADERVCPVCGPLAGQEWLADTGPQPPAHANCRCQRVFSRAEYRVRP